MFYLIVSVHFFLCFLLVGLVLVQQGKGADMGATFGSGGSNTLFGAAGAAPTIVKLTAGVCILFMVTSILLIRNYDEFSQSAAPVDALQGSAFNPQQEGSAPQPESSTEAAPAPADAAPMAANGASTTGEAATGEAPESAAPNPGEPVPEGQK